MSTVTTPRTAAVSGAARRSRLVVDVELAADILAPTWPLETFIAVNPLGGLESLPFGDALAVAGDVFGARGTLTEPEFRARHAEGRITDADLDAAIAAAHPALVRRRPLPLGSDTIAPVALIRHDLLHGHPAPAPVRRTTTAAEATAPDVARAVDAQTVKWCAAFLDAGQAAWAMPGREVGFYPAWRALAPLDRTLAADVRERLRRLPEQAEDALLDALDDLGVADEAHRRTLRAHLSALPGWAAHIRRRGQDGDRVDLVAFLALRLSYEAALLGGQETDATVSGGPPRVTAGSAATTRAARVAQGLGLAVSPGQLLAAAQVLDEVPVEHRGLLWLAAYEGHFRDGLLQQLAAGPAAAVVPRARPRAQVVCCIDARSEGLRRHLEAHGRDETLGFAGFFAVAIRFQDLAGGRPSALCPVLLQPRNPIRERPLAGAEALAARHLAGRRALAGAEDAFHAAKDDALAPFALAEASGWWAGPLAAAKTLSAGRYGELRSRLRARVVPDTPTVLTVADGFTPEERDLIAEVALTMMGLTGGFGRLVVLCGHGSTTENNPYAAALACGACGGNAGAPNARTAAAILNEDAVREHLRGRGIDVPADTWFVAAEHDTATDRVAVLDAHLVPASHREELAGLGADLEAAGARLSAERCATLPGAPVRPSVDRAARHVQGRSTDWAQVFPEWGLAGNAAFIVGPRAMTRGVDLHRRAFLHSYEAAADRDGAALETILTAPLVVAQWINCQYYFSSVEPGVFGAGTKTIHNVVGGIGVLAGHDGDLQLGLPWQSVGVGSHLVHEPMRLLALVQAPLARIDEIVARNTVLQQLFGNGWVTLAAREHAAHPWQRPAAGGWTPWTPAGPPDPHHQSEEDTA